MSEHKSEVYIMTDVRNRITRIEGEYTVPADLTGWTKIDEGAGDKYNLAQVHYLDKPLYTPDGIPQYKLENGRAVERAEEEIAADLAALPEPEPTTDELLDILLGVSTDG